MALLSDFEGRATKIAVATPGLIDPATAQANLARQLGNLPAHLHPDCKIYWIHKASDAPIPAFEIDGRAIVPVPVCTGEQLPGHMRWVQDPFVCVVEQGQPALVLPIKASVIAKEMVLDLAAALGWRVKPVDFWLEGGNVMAMGDVGIDGVSVFDGIGSDPRA